MEVDQDQVGLATNEEALRLLGVRGQVDPPVAVRIEGLLQKAKTGGVVADHDDVWLG